MILQQFPDLDWLKHQISNDFNDRKGWDKSILKTNGWPSVLLNVKSSHTYRDDIKGPLSLFMNIHGTSHVYIDGRKVTIHDDNFYLTNRNQTYDLEVEKDAETFNIHIGNNIDSGVYQYLIKTDSQLLDDPYHYENTAFYNRHYTRSATINDFVNAVKSNPENVKNNLWLQEKLSDLTLELFALNQENIINKRKLAATKRSTREELYVRLLRAFDYIQDNFLIQINLDDLSMVACMSKYHFLRAFKNAFKQTPHQMITQLRINKAIYLLRTTKRTVNEVAVKVGFENSSSFSRLLYQKTGQYPSSYR